MVKNISRVLEILSVYITYVKMFEYFDANFTNQSGKFSARLKTIKIQFLKRRVATTIDNWQTNFHASFNFHIK